MNALVTLLHQSEVERLGWVLVHLVWQGGIVAMTLWAALRLLRCASANARYIASCVAMALLVALPVVTWITLPRGVVASPWTNVVEPMPARSTPAATATPGRHEMPPSATGEWSAAYLRPLLPSLATLWLVGVFGLSIYHAAGWIYLRRLRNHAAPPLDAKWQQRLDRLCARLGLRRSVALLESAAVQVPSVLGWLRPVILVPASALSGLTPQQLDALLMHELAHIRRHDYLVNLVQVVVETLLFYHPATWWISRQVRQEREHCCDDAAVALCGDRLLYAQSLADMEALRGLRSELALGASGGNLLARIRRLLTPSTQSPSPRPGSLVMALTIAAVILLPLTMVQLRAADEKAKPAAPTTRPTSPLPEDLLVVFGDYVISPDDVVQVIVRGVPGGEVPLQRVRPTGRLELPFFDEQIDAAGLTEAQLREKIAKKLTDEKGMAQPEVTVKVHERLARLFDIVGAVTRPGTYALTRSNFRVLDALLLAGELKGEPRTVYVIRRNAHAMVRPQTRDQRETTQRIIEIPMKELLSANLDYNVVIRQFDMVVVSPDAPDEK